MSELEGKMTKEEMAKLAGINPDEIDKSLKGLADKGLIRYHKTKNGGYHYTMIDISEIEGKSKKAK